MGARRQRGGDKVQQDRTCLYGVATRSSRIAFACNPSAREAEQQDRVPSRRRLHRQALPLKHNANRPKSGRRSTLPHSGPGGTNLSPRNSHKTGLEFAEILLPDWVTCPCLKPTTASIQSGWMEKTVSRFTRTQGDQKMGNAPEERSEQYQEGGRALGNKNG